MAPGFARSLPQQCLFSLLSTDNNACCFCGCLAAAGAERTLIFALKLLFPRHQNDSVDPAVWESPSLSPCLQGWSGNCLGHCRVSLHSYPSHCLPPWRAFRPHLSSWSRHLTVTLHGRAQPGEGGSSFWGEKQHWSPCSVVRQ